MGHYELFDYVNEIDYLKFYEREMAYRKELCYPPYYRLAEIELRHTQEQIVERDGKAIVMQFMDFQKTNPQLIILGPSKPLIHKINHVFMRKIILKAPDMGSDIVGVSYH